MVRTWGIWVRGAARIALARRLRAAPTQAEAVLWERLRKRALHGWKFRRQADLGPYIIDFMCHAPPLAVEIDGPVHALFRAEKDVARDAWIAAQGYRVLRITARDVRDDMIGVLKRIEAAGLSPPPQAGEGQGWGDVGQAWGEVGFSSLSESRNDPRIVSSIIDPATPTPTPNPSPTPTPPPQAGEGRRTRRWRARGGKPRGRIKTHER